MLHLSPKYLSGYIVEAVTAIRGKLVYRPKMLSDDVYAFVLVEASNLLN